MFCINFCTSKHKKHKKAIQKSNSTNANDPLDMSKAIISFHPLRRNTQQKADNQSYGEPENNPQKLCQPINFFQPCIYQEWNTEVNATIAKVSWMLSMYLRLKYFPCSH